jgi:hypothetical protein
METRQDSVLSEFNSIIDVSNYLDNGLSCLWRFKSFMVLREVLEAKSFQAS